MGETRQHAEDGTRDPREDVTDLMEALFDHLDAYLGPDLTISTSTKGDEVRVQVIGVIELDSIPTRLHGGSQEDDDA